MSSSRPEMIDLAVVAAFVALALWNGMRARRRASRNLEEYFLAGRDVAGWKSGLSMAATQYAADTPLLATGLVATGGLFLLWRFWIYGFGFLLLAFVFGELWRRAGVLTDAELTEIRYSGRGVLALRILKAVYFGTVVNSFFLAMILTAAVRITEVFLPWHRWLPPSLYQSLAGFLRALGLGDSGAFLSIVLVLAFVLLYSTLGGLRGVVVTDILQFGFAMVGTLVYAVLIVDAAGGLGGLGARIVEIYGETRGREFLGFLPSRHGALFPFLAVIGLQGLFWIGSDGTGYLAQRAMACRSDRDARAAGVVFTWVQVFLRSLVWLVIGLGLLVLYPFTEAEAGAAGFAAAREMTFVTGINDLMPAGLKGLMLAGLLAALASTIDTHLNWGASYWTNDIYARLVCRAWLKRTPRDRELVVAARLSNFVILGLALVIMGALGSIQATWFVSLLFGAGVGGVLMLRWLWHRINLWSEVAALGVSLTAAPILLIAVGEEWVRLGLMVLVSMGAAVAAALFGPRTDGGTVTRFFERVRPPGAWKAVAGEGVRPEAGLWKRTKTALFMAASLLLALTGLVRLLIPVPGISPAAGWVSIAAAFALIPLWRSKSLL
ncbi:MAG: sodium transporter [Acidobacteriota bacterium]|nr:sodium transporter [Acidobacteriota bacterium]